MIEVMQVTDDIAFFDACAAIQHAFVMTVKWGHGETIAIDHLQLSLCA